MADQRYRRAAGSLGIVGKPLEGSDRPMQHGQRRRWVSSAKQPSQRMAALS